MSSNLTDELIVNEIVNSQLRPVTIKNYTHKLTIIQSKFYDDRKTIVYILNHIDEFKQKLLLYASTQKGRLGQDHLSPHSIKNYVSVFLHIIKTHNEFNNLLSAWQNLSMEVQKPINDHYDTNQPTERQQKSFIPLNEIEKIRDSLPHGDVSRLLVSMYTLIKPLRCDFGNVKLFTAPPTDKYDNNYIVLNEQPMLCLNQFKTQGIYNQLNINLPPLLVEQINASLQQRPRDFLFTTMYNQPYNSSNSFDKWANDKLKKIFKNQGFCLSMFRHIVISDPQLDIVNKTRSERKEIAHEMGHSLNTQDMYRWIEPSKPLPIPPIKKIRIKLKNPLPKILVTWKPPNKPLPPIPNHTNKISC